MSEIKKIEEEYDLKILELLELKLQRYDKLKEITLKIEKKETLERNYVKYIYIYI